MIKIMFISDTNRSKAIIAESIFSNMIRENNLEYDIKVISRCITDENFIEDKEKYSDVYDKLTKKNLPIVYGKAIKLTISEYNEYDYVIVTEEDDIKGILNIIGEDTGNKIKKISDFNRRIDDDYISSIFSENQVDDYQKIYSSCEGIIEDIKNNYKLIYLESSNSNSNRNMILLAIIFLIIPSIYFINLCLGDSMLLTNSTSYSINSNSALKIEKAKAISSPRTQDDFEYILGYMMNNNLTEYSFKCSNSGNLSIYTDMIQNALEKYSGIYPEHGSFLYGGRVDNADNGMIVIKLNLVHNSSSLDKQKTKYFNECKKIYSKLCSSNKITSEMTEREKASAIYEYMSENYRYKLPFLGHEETPYDMVKNKKGVCEGYTIVYNTLCKLAGIKIIAVPGRNNSVKHIWSLALIDGRETYIDVTFGTASKTSVKKLDYSWLGKSYSEMTAADHISDLGNRSMYDIIWK